MFTTAHTLPRRFQQIGALNMALPSFSAGQRVSVARAKASLAPDGIYQIVRALPVERGPVRYRIKSDSEAFERIVDESCLEAIHYG